MIFKENFKKKEKREKTPTIEVIRGSETPEENKDNPFYNSYHWGMADWVDKKLYLPDNSDEAISFSIAAHELGHLVKKDRIQPSRFEFELTYQEELRAWSVGWNYLKRHIAEYFDGNQEAVFELEKIKNAIEKELMEITELTKPFYQLTDKDKNEQRKEFLSTETGKLVKEKIDNLQVRVQGITTSLALDKYLKKIDWHKFKEVVKKTLVDIEKEKSADSMGS